MHDLAWADDLAVAVTATSADGTITYLNAFARHAFRDSGDLIGKSVFDCHPEHALDKTRALYAAPGPNHYTIEKNGVRKIIHQLPRYRGGAFAGVVEISVPIPDELPHFVRRPA